jgi:acyl-CoA synthetase (AMP-forming)/AMP-acid ligase II
MVDAAPDLLTLVRRAAARLGEAPWFTIGEQRCSAAEFARRVEWFASGLLASGCRPGDRLALLLPRSLDEAIGLLGIAAAGGIAVPVHARLKDEQVLHVLQDCAPFAVVTDRLRLLALADPAGVLAGQRVLAAGDTALPVAHAPWPRADGALQPPAPGSPAVLLYTSGSTGRAKGIVQDHRNLTLGAAIVAEYLGLTQADHLLALLPFSFDYGLNQLLSALHVGCRITAADHLGVGELGGLLRAHRPTGLAGVPSLWHEIAMALHSGSLSRGDGASLRYVTNSGGSLRTSDSRCLRQHWPHVQLFAMYGLTEAFRSAYLPPAEFDAHPDSFGRALPGVELLLVCPTSGEVLDGPATGELVHAGALVSCGRCQ